MYQNKLFKIITTFKGATTLINTGSEAEAADSPGFSGHRKSIKAFIRCHLRSYLFVLSLVNVFFPLHEEQNKPQLNYF